MESSINHDFINACPKCMRNHACRNCGRREPRGKLMATDWLADKPIETNQRLVEVIFKNTRVGFFENSENLPLQIGDVVVVEGTPGYDIGRVNMMGHLVNLQMKKSGFKEFTELKSVLRLASEEDLDKFEEARSREHSTMIKARSIAEELGLAMKIGDVEFQGDGSKAIFYYIADERVDFRKLIRILAETFKVKFGINTGVADTKTSERKTVIISADGIDIDADAYKMQGVYGDIEAVLKALGIDYSYDGETLKASYNENSIETTIRSSEMIVNGEPSIINDWPEVIDDVLYAEISAIASNLGLNVKESEGRYEIWK